MERKDIIFDGVSNVPDDSNVEDGQLSLCVNAIKTDGSIHPVKKGKPVLDETQEKNPIVIESDERLVYVHHLPDTGEERMIVLGTEPNYPPKPILSKFSVTFNYGEGNTFIENEDFPHIWGHEDGVVVYADTLEGLCELPTASKENYSFLGWKTDEESDVFFDGVYEIQSDVVFIAAYDNGALEPYHLAFNTDGGTFVGNEDFPTSTVKTDGIPRVMVLPTATRNNYSFKGWKILFEGEPYGELLNGEFEIDGDLEFIAIWELDEYVDLGLESGTLWATCNVGASSPEEYGNYYAWGETEEKEEYTWANYKYGAHASSSSMTKYNNSDGKKVLDDTDDAAYISTIGRFQMPTLAQFSELKNPKYTSTEIVEVNNVKCLKITGKNGNSILLPAAGDNLKTASRGGQSSDTGERGYYWSRTCGSTAKYLAHRLEFGEGLVQANTSMRAIGCTIRPVLAGAGDSNPPNRRPSKKEGVSGDIEITILDGWDTIELVGSLDEGRTLTMELTYTDGVKETTSVRFTKEDSYILPVYYKLGRKLSSAREIVYDDDSTNISITFNIVEVMEDEYAEEIESAIKDGVQIEIDGHSYYYSSIIGTFDVVDIPEPAYKARQNARIVYSDAVDETTGETSQGRAIVVSWFNKKTNTRSVICKLNTSIREITSVKNVLIISTDAGLYFARNIGQGYQYLGQLPELPCIIPHLSYKWTAASSYPVLELDRSIDTTNWTSFAEGTANRLASEVRKDLWKKIAAILGNLRKEIWRNGHFMSPFQVRVAYRMFDGTYISVSRPFLMCPSSVYQPFILFVKTQDEHPVTNVEAIASESALSLSINGSIPADWQDIITGFDIFISPEIEDYTADESGDSVDWVYLKQDDADTLAEDDNVTDRTSVVGETPIGWNVPLFVNPSNVEANGVNVSYLDALSSEEALPYGDIAETTYNVSAGQWVAVSRSISSDRVPRVEGNTYTLNADTYGYYTFYVLPASMRGQIKAETSSPDVFTSGLFVPKETSQEYPYYCRLLEYLGDDADNYVIYSGSRTSRKDNGDFGYPTYYRCFQVQQNCSLKIYHVSTGKKTLELNNPIAFVHLKRTTGKAVEEEFNTQNSFYRIDSVNFRDLKSDEDYSPTIHSTDIELLTSKKQLDTSVVNRYAFNCNDIYVYNNRMNAVVDEQELEKPDYADTLYMGVDVGKVRDEAPPNISYAVEVVKDGITRIVPVPKTDTCKTYEEALRYFFYPNQNATRLIEYIEGGVLGTTTLSVTRTVDSNEAEFSSTCKLIGNTINYYSLTQHEGIYGSYAFNDWMLLEPASQESKVTKLEIGEITTTESGTFQASFYESIHDEYLTMFATDSVLSRIDMNSLSLTTEEKQSADAITKSVTGTNDIDLTETIEKVQSGYQQRFEVGNKILQSDIENPFAFLNRGVVQLGCETIKRICATSRPVSEGQAGEHPLYAFTEEGIFALGVNADGSYSIVTHLSPEVLTGDDVTQVEQNIVFSTSKGLMNLVGGDIICLSSRIEGHNHAEDTYTDSNNRVREAIDMISRVKELAGLCYVDSIGSHAKDWFTEANMLYDPKHNLLYLFHEQYPDNNGEYATNLGLVYDITNGAWGMYENNLMYGVNSYTDALAVEKISEDGTGVLVNMSDQYMCGEKMYNSLILTRPLEFGYNDIYKTLEDVLLRGAQGSTNSKLVIWASNDLNKWFIIGSSQNYKWRNFSGTPYKYFRIGVLVNEWQEGDSITGLSVDVTPRITNKLR